MIKIMFICLGNICRSTLSESLFTHLVKEKKIDHNFEIASSATGTEELGNYIHHGTVDVLKKNNINIVDHRAVQVTKEDGDYYDYLICMDSNNIKDLKRIISPKNYHKIKLLNKVDIADPWYTGNFDKTYKEVYQGCLNLLDALSVDL